MGGDHSPDSGLHYEVAHSDREAQLPQTQGVRHSYGLEGLLCIEGPPPGHPRSQDNAFFQLGEVPS